MLLWAKLKKKMINSTMACSEMLMKVIKTLIVKTTRLLRAKTLSTLTSGEVVMRVRTQNRTKMKAKMIRIEKKNGERKRLHL